jgi:hypothetical protein
MIISSSSFDLQGGMLGVSESEFWKRVLAFDSVQFYIIVISKIGKYVKEGIRASLEGRVRLTIVHKDLALVDYRH